MSRLEREAKVSLAVSLISRAVVVVVAVSAVVTAHVGVRAQSSDVPSRVIEPRAVDLTFEQALREVLAEARVPGGIVLLQSGGSDESTHYQFGGMLGDTIRMFGDLHSDYRTELVNGVVTVRPAKGVPPILLTRIRRIELAAGDPVYKGWNDIRESAEFEDSRERLHLGEGWGSPDGPGQPKTLLPFNGDSGTVVLTDATVLDILDEIVRRSGTAVWVYREHPTETGRAYTFRVR